MHALESLTCDVMEQESPSKAGFFANVSAPLPRLSVTFMYSVSHGSKAHSHSMVHIQESLPKVGFLASPPLPPLTATFTYGGEHSSRTQSHTVGRMALLWGAVCTKHMEIGTGVELA